MRFRIFAILLTVLVFSWAAQYAQAGVIRFAGKQLGKGSVAVANATVSGGQAAAGGVATAGRTTGGAIKAGAVAVADGAKATPGLVARGSKAAGKGIVKAIW